MREIKMSEALPCHIPTVGRFVGVSDADMLSYFYAAQSLLSVQLCFQDVHR